MFRFLQPRRLGVVLLQRVELLLHPLPALQAAPQPIGVDHVKVLAVLRLANLLGAWVWTVEGVGREKGQKACFTKVGESQTEGKNVAKTCWVDTELMLNGPVWNIWLDFT